MKKLLPIILLSLFLSYSTKAQTNQAYGDVSMDDLLLKDCPFEKGANAMVLLDMGDAVTDIESVSIKYFKRTKIFSSAGRDLANVRINYHSGNDLEDIRDVEAETINWENGKIVITKVDEKQIYTEQIDKYHKAIVFAFPQVKPGSIIEYKYHLITRSPLDFRGWSFQENIPVRYSELTAKIAHSTLYNIITKGYQPFVKDTSILLSGFIGKGDRQCWWAKANVHSYVAEPFVTQGVDNTERIIFRLSFASSGMDFVRLSDTWEKIAFKIIFDPYFVDQLDQRISKQDTLLKQAQSLATDDEKIAFLFNEVKKNMTWNKANSWLADKGAKTAWNNKIGNSAEINLILYNLLKRAKIKVYPMLLSTRYNGVIEHDYAEWGNINTMVSYVPTADSTQYYVLDASNKYNVYNEVPIEFLNTYGVIIYPAKRENVSAVKYLKNETTAKHIVIIDATISADNEVAGTTDIVDYSYNRKACLELHKVLDEKQYSDYLIAGINDLKITKPVFENMEVDSLPLMQKFNFTHELTGGNDNQYIYFNSNLFTPFNNNPFINEKRYSDIDFGYCNSYSINGTYKLPIGYKIDVLPKSMVLNMPDKSIIFKRVIGQLNGALQVHYNITYSRSTYSIGEYKPLHDFYKKMYDMLNEPIVLKKE